MTKGAIIVGISDYRYINDLSYCDDDARDWYDYLKKLGGWDIKVFGDMHKQQYQIYNGLATEVNVRTALVEFLKKYDEVLFVSSGHGESMGGKDVYLCMEGVRSTNNMYDEKYTDKELLYDINQRKENCKVTIFLDHCHSGGMLDELENLDNIIAMSTCSEFGYGYDVPKCRGMIPYTNKSFKIPLNEGNGAWTHTFLNRALKRGVGGGVLTEAFTWAKREYPYKGKNDEPQMIFSNNMKSYKL